MYEHVYLHAYESVAEAKQQLAMEFTIHNTLNRPGFRRHLEALNLRLQRGCHEQRTIYG